MAEEKRWTGSTRGWFLLGESYGEPGPGVSLTELANLLILTSATVERVEEHSRVQAHLASESVSLSEPRRSRARPSWIAPALAGMAVFALGLGVGRFMSSESAPSADQAPSVAGRDLTAAASPYLLGTGSADAGTIAYPLPAKPFSDQAMAPCKRYEIDLNGGCWLELGQRPPCEKDVHVEHQGKCYAPVAKRPRAPQAVDPTGR